MTVAPDGPSSRSAAVTVLVVAVGVVTLAVAGLAVSSGVGRGHNGPTVAASRSEDGSMIKTLYVNSELVDCVGVEPRKCLQVRESPDDDWELFYDDIQGFDFEPGYRYELRVDVRQVEEPPADASSLHHELVEVVDKTRA